MVAEGSSAVDTRMLTGESVPVEVGAGDAVVGATVNAGGRLVVRATRVGADTQLAQMARLVEDAQNGKAAVQRLADRVSAVFVPIVIGLAAATLGCWLGSGGGAGGRVHRRRRGADHRLPVRAGPGHADRAAGRHRPRRAARHPDQGPGGAGVHPAGRHRGAGQDRHRHHRADDPGRRAHRRGRRGDEVLRLAGALEDASEHPIAAAIAARRPGARRRCRPSRTSRTWTALACKGWSTGTRCSSAGTALLADWGQPLPGELAEAKAAAEERAAHGGRGGLGRRGPRRAGGRRHGQADVGRGDRPAARRSGSRRCC